VGVGGENVLMPGDVEGDGRITVGSWGKWEGVWRGGRHKKNTKDIKEKNTDDRKGSMFAP